MGGVGGCDAVEGGDCSTSEVDFDEVDEVDEAAILHSP